jgi:hypothetical protein
MNLLDLGFDIFGAHGSGVLVKVGMTVGTSVGTFVGISVAVIFVFPPQAVMKIESMKVSIARI